MSDVFSRIREASGDSGRICKIGRDQQTVRLRSLPVWVGVHWVDGPGLCAGTACPLCVAGIPRRAKAWLAVDRPNGTFASLEVTERDLAAMSAAAAEHGSACECGLTLLLVRRGERQPLTVLGARVHAGLGEVSQDVLMADVLRFHGVMASREDVKSGDYRRLVTLRAHELAQKARVYA